MELQVVFIFRNVSICLWLGNGKQPSSISDMI